MVKLTQAIRRQQPTNCLSVLDHFVGLARKGLKKLLNQLMRIICTKIKTKDMHNLRKSGNQKQESTVNFTTVIIIKTQLIRK